MPQGPFPTFPPAAGTRSKLFINTTNAPVVIKATQGFIGTISVLAGSATGSVYDCATTAGAITANEIAVIPDTVGPVVLNFPCLTGITVQLGSGMELSVSYT